MRDKKMTTNKEALEALSFIEKWDNAGYWKSGGIKDQIKTIRKALQQPEVSVREIH